MPNISRAARLARLPLLAAGKKDCPGCRLIQPLRAFGLRANGTPQSWCLECSRIGPPAPDWIERAERAVAEVSSR